MPLKYAEENTVVYNVFGDTWVKSSHCGWHKSLHYHNLGEIHDIELDPENYNVYDIIEYKRNDVTHKIYKCCNKCFILVQPCRYDCFLYRKRFSWQRTS